MPGTTLRPSTWRTMCRFLCYRGPALSLEALLYEPPNSLILQSYKARERSEPLNGDGFGVGWYAPGVGPTPCVFTSVTPAWGNANLRRLARHIRSPCFFAHVRAASPGMRVSEENCHPFQYGPYLWMHNGAIGEFAKIKRRLRASLDDNVYESIQGTTDSEHAFAVFLSLLGGRRPDSASGLGEVLVETIRRLEHWSSEAGVRAPSFYNFAVTDGERLATVRYCSDPRREPVSLYFAAAKRFVVRDGRCRLECGSPGERAVIIASERLTEERRDWTRVAPNHVLTVSDSYEASVDLIRL
jgi:glutamine amidotransferase